MRTLADALKGWDQARQQDTPAPRESPLSPPDDPWGKGGLEGFRERWQRQWAADRGLLPSAKVVLVAISWHLNRGEGTAWPSLRTLAEETALAPSSIDRLARMAQERGHLQITYGNSSQRKSNTYTPVLKQPGGLSDLDRTAPRPDAGGLSDLDGTPCPIQTGQTVPHCGTEPLNEPLNEPPNKGRGTFDEKGEYLGAISAPNH